MHIKSLSQEDLDLLTELSASYRAKWFNRLFLYITTACQLRCSHCYLGRRLENPEIMNLNDVRANLAMWRSLGARTVCILGGEPSLHPQLESIVQDAHGLKYEQVIIDTNGLHPSLREIRQFEPDAFSYVQVSLDGGTSEAHEAVRGPGTFVQTLDTILELCRRGFDVRVICTVSKRNVLGALDMLELVESAGASLIKYHISSTIGNAADRLGDALDPQEWNAFISDLKKRATRHRIVVQYQPSYVHKKACQNHSLDGFAGCVGRQLERVSVFPDGRAYICSFLFDTDLHFATVENGQLKVRRGPSELDLYRSIADDCVRCSVRDRCLNGCPAESIVLGCATCEAHPSFYGMCRLWKATVRKACMNGESE